MRLSELEWLQWHPRTKGEERDNMGWKKYGGEKELPSSWFEDAFSEWSSSWIYKGRRETERERIEKERERECVRVCAYLVFLRNKLIFYHFYLFPQNLSFREERYFG